MKIIVAIHGKPKDKRILEIMEEYKTKISRYQKIDFEFLTPTNLPLERGGTVQKVLNKYSGKKVYFLDEDGKEYTSQKFAENYEKDLNDGEKEVVFVIGPAEGFGILPANLNSISLSKFAMQHDIAALVLIEQIYRAISIKNNLPYHKV